jgi:hypothetical protein
MRDSLAQARIRSELWRAYAMMRQRPGATMPAGASAARGRRLQSLRHLLGTRRSARSDGVTPPD